MPYNNLRVSIREIFGEVYSWVGCEAADALFAKKQRGSGEAGPPSASLVRCTSTLTHHVRSYRASTWGPRGSLASHRGGDPRATPPYRRAPNPHPACPRGDLP